MRRMLRLLLALACGAGVFALLPGAGKPGKAKSGMIGPLPAAGEIHISANSLRIQPGKEANYLRFGDGVEITGPGFALHAAVVEMDVLSSSLGLKDVKLPQLSEPPERVIADPGSTVQRMVGEIRGPSAKLEASALRRIAASGSIRVSAAGAELQTETVFSEDGGRSWSTGGTAQIRLASPGKAGPTQASFRAGLISFNSGTQEVLARGTVHGEFRPAGQAPLMLDAAELRGNLKTGAVKIVGGVTASSGTVRLATAQGDPAPPVRFNLKTNQLNIDGPFSIADSARGLTLEGGGAGADLTHRQVDATGPVHIVSTTDKLELTASRLEAVLEPLKLTATGKVHLQYGASSYDAEHAVLTQSGKKLIVEIEGRQSGQIDLQGMQQKKKK
jgi:hypothetical protein